MLLLSGNPVLQRMDPEGVIVVQDFCFLVEEQDLIVWHKILLPVFPEPVTKTKFQYKVSGIIRTPYINQFLNINRHMKKIILFFIILLIVQGCKNDNKNIVEYPATSLLLKSPKAFKHSDFVDSVSFVNLELNENSMFASLDKILFKNGNYYIFDRMGSAHVYVFSGSGKFISKIGSIGRGPHEYTRLRDFDVDNSGNVLLSDSQRKRILKYNTYGEFLEEYKLENIRADAVKVLENGNYLFSIAKESPKETLIDFHLVLTDANFNVIDKSLPMDTDFKDNYLVMNYLRQSSSGITYCKPPRPIIYKLDEKGAITEQLSLDFEKPAPIGFINDTEAEQEYSNASFETLGYSRPILTRHYIFGNSDILKAGNWQSSFFVYDLNKKVFYQNILNPANFSHKNINMPILAIDDTNIVSYLEPSMLEYDTDKDELPKGVKAHLEKSGFVLVRYHLKKKINE